MQVSAHFVLCRYWPHVRYQGNLNVCLFSIILMEFSPLYHAPSADKSFSNIHLKYTCSINTWRFKLLTRLSFISICNFHFSHLLYIFYRSDCSHIWLALRASHECCGRAIHIFIFIIQVVIFIIVLLHQNKQRFDLKLMDVAREKKSRYQVDVEIKKKLLKSQVQVEPNKLNLRLL